MKLRDFKVKGILQKSMYIKIIFFMDTMLRN
jgi:hypothetical protein